MKIKIEDKYYEVEDIHKIVTNIPNYVITSHIMKDNRAVDINFTNIQDANKCLFMMNLYQQIYVYALQHNKAFNDYCYIILFNDDLKAQVRKIKVGDYTGIFDIAFSDEQIALDCIHMLDAQLADYEKT